SLPAVKGTQGNPKEDVAMEFKGSPEFVEFWELLKNESARCVVIVVAAFFDEKLGTLLGQGKGSFDSRINNALAVGMLSQNEHNDLHEIRKIRNVFAHNLRTNSFDAHKSKEINSIKTWNIAVGEWPEHAEWFPTPKERFLYVAAVLAFRLNHR